MKTIEATIYSNLIIAIAIVGLCFQTQIQLGYVSAWQPFMGFVFFAAMLEYHIQRLVVSLFSREMLLLEKYKWIKQNPYLFYVFAFTSFLGFIVAISFLDARTLLILTPAMVLTGLYSFPAIVIKCKLHPLRAVPYFKIFIISWVWAYVSVCVPMLAGNYTFDRTGLVLVFLERFFFIFSITIPFDIRDMKTDTLAGLKTIPIQLGESKSIRLANAALLVFGLLVIMHYSINSSKALLFALLLSGAITALFINMDAIKRLRHYHYGILDGAMVLQSVLVCCFPFIKC